MGAGSVEAETLHVDLQGRRGLGGAPVCVCRGQLSSLVKISPFFCSYLAGEGFPGLGQNGGGGVIARPGKAPSGCSLVCALAGPSCSTGQVRESY